MLAAAEERRSETDAEVERILEEAREEGRGMVLEAKEVRSRVLEDLQRRRDLARDQIERLLAGRERLLAAYGLVRENLDDITEQLADSLPDPGEPDLPDGFVGIVGSSAIAADDELHEADASTCPVAGNRTSPPPRPSRSSWTTPWPPRRAPAPETEAGDTRGTDDADGVEAVAEDSLVADLPTRISRIRTWLIRVWPSPTVTMSTGPPTSVTATLSSPTTIRPAEPDADEAEEHDAGLRR